MEILSGVDLAARLQVSSKMIQRMTAAGQIPHIKISDRIIRYDLADVVAALQVAHHTDDDAVTQFAQAMRQRMAEKRDAGYSGWESADVQAIGLKLLRAIAKGDPIDVGNYAMMFHSLQADTTHVIDESLSQLLYEMRSGYCITTEALMAAVGDLIDQWKSEDGSISGCIETLIKVSGK